MQRSNAMATTVDLERSAAMLEETTFVPQPGRAATPWKRKNQRKRQLKLRRRSTAMATSVGLLRNAAMF